MSRLSRSFTFASLLLAVALPADRARGGDSPSAPAPSEAVARSLANLRIGAGVAADQVILFPVYAMVAPPALDVHAGIGDAKVAFSESEPKFGIQNVRATSAEAKPALLLAGTVIEGGRRDRVLRFDRLIPAGETTDIEVMPASAARDTRPKGKEFRMAEFLAPSYLRESVQFSSDTGVVPRFVSHFLEFRDPSDSRQSLVAIAGSAALAEYCLACQRSFSEWPALKEVKETGTPVGAILVARGRVQSMEVFANNEHLRAYLPHLLMSLAFPAAAIALRAKQVDIPLPGSNDPALTIAGAMNDAAELLAGLASATYTRRRTDAGFLGESWLLHVKGGTRGTALVFDGRLVHATVYPGDPFEDSLYSKPLAPLDPEDVSQGGDPGSAELERRAALGARLTPAEQRLLDRMRQRLPPIR